MKGKTMKLAQIRNAVVGAAVVASSAVLSAEPDPTFFDDALDQIEAGVTAITPIVVGALGVGLGLFLYRVVKKWFSKAA